MENTRKIQENTSKALTCLFPVFYLPPSCILLVFSLPPSCTLPCTYLSPGIFKTNRSIKHQLIGLAFLVNAKITDPFKLNFIK